MIATVFDCPARVEPNYAGLPIMQFRDFALPNIKLLIGANGMMVNI